MDIFNLLSNSTPPVALQPKLTETLAKLEATKTFEATVVKNNQGEVRLNSKFGELLVNSKIPLLVGDKITAKLVQKKSQWTVKVVQHDRTSLQIPASKNLSLLKFIQNNPLALITRVKAQTKNHTLLEFPRETIKIPAQKELTVGQLLKIKHQPKLQSIQISPVDARQVLKTALTQLLPKSSTAKPSNSLPELLQTISTLAGKDAKSINSIIAKFARQTDPIKENIEPRAENKSRPIKTQSAQIQPKQTAESNLVTPSKINIDAKKFDTDSMLTSRPIQQILQSLPQWSRIDSQSIHRLFTMLGLIKNPTSLTEQLPDQLRKLQLASESKNTDLIRQIAQILSRNSSAVIKASADLPILEIAALLAKELNLQLETAFTQLLLQQTSARYQQEAGQNTQLSFSIPVADEHLIKPVNINIRQKSSDRSNEKSAWEIQLAFDFAGLGMISSKILLDDNQVSTSFWAETPATQQKIEQHMDGFKTQLSTAGFELGYFNCFAGKPAAKKPETDTNQVASLLDIKV